VAVCIAHGARYAAKRAGGRGRRPAGLRRREHSALLPPPRVHALADGRIDMRERGDAMEIDSA
jgi:hypothetical protein